MLPSPKAGRMPRAPIRAGAISQPKASGSAGWSCRFCRMNPRPWPPRTHASCRGAAPGTRDQAGNYVPLGEQDADLWDKEMIAEAEALLRAASRMDAAGRYQLEAAVQSAHAVRRLTGRPDWAAIETLYDSLYALTLSPVVAINRAIAIAETKGPAAGLAAIDAIAGDPRLREYLPYWAALAELSARAGDHAGAEAAYRLASASNPIPPSAASCRSAARTWRGSTGTGRGMNRVNLSGWRLCC